MSQMVEYLLFKHLLASVKPLVQAPVSAKTKITWKFKTSCSLFAICPGMLKGQGESYIFFFEKQVLYCLMAPCSPLFLWLF
jgi:hypothetical protein